MPARPGCAILRALMPILTLNDAQLAYGLHPLLDQAGLAVRAGDRIGLIGRNGTGKSSLLKVIAGELALDGGEIRRRDGLAVTLVEQEPVLPPAATLRESLAAARRTRAHPGRAPALERRGQAGRVPASIRAR